MTAADMIDLLALRLEDAGKGKFPDGFKLTALNNGQIRVAQMLDNHYLTELQLLETNIAVTSGVAALSLLDKDVLRGGEGIQMIKKYDTGGLYMNMIDIKNIKSTENSFLAGSSTNPLAYVFANNIYILPTSITAIDVWYLKMPTPLLNKFQSSAHGTAQVGKFLGDVDQGLSAVDDAYGGGTTEKTNSVIYDITKDAYFVVTDYVATNREFTVSPDATDNFGDGEFYFLTHDFDQLTLSAITSDLNPSLHDLVVTFAEAECWTMSANLTRRQAALDNAFNEIKILNDRYTPAEGIGTDGNR